MSKSVALARIEGDTEDVQTVINMFAYIKEIIRRGAGKTIKIRVDGDGSADCKCFLSTNKDEMDMVLENTKWEEVYFKQDSSEINERIDSAEGIDLYIGE